MLAALFANPSNPAAFMRFPAITPITPGRPDARLRVEGVLLEPNQPVSVGREGDIQVFRQFKWISRRHLELKIDAQGWLCVRDLNSAAGTYINNLRINGEWHIVQEKDVIWLGHRGLCLTVTRE
jgi:pSer/pThr/pTyr-binding forkhead associated (FHA) protein